LKETTARVASDAMIDPPAMIEESVVLPNSACIIASPG
jgi:UDP-3-O-[3-hydroxymyristoyl] glucosamine N-acyltransferase